MAAPSVGRRSRQRQGVVPYEGIENGGLEFYFKTAVRYMQNEHEKSSATQRFLPPADYFSY